MLWNSPWILVHARDEDPKEPIFTTVLKLIFFQIRKYSGSILRRISSSLFCVFSSCSLLFLLLELLLGFPCLWLFALLSGRFPQVNLPPLLLNFMCLLSCFWFPRTLFFCSLNVLLKITFCSWYVTSSLISLEILMIFKHFFLLLPASSLLPPSCVISVFLIRGFSRKSDNPWSSPCN